MKRELGTSIHYRVFVGNSKGKRTLGKSGLL